MSNKLSMILIVTIVLLFPINMFALNNDKYSVLNLEETLTEENIEKSFDNYSEDDNQVIIYMFRGDGCVHCRNFLSFLNSITSEYGKYFKLRSFEVWHNSENAGLMGLVSNHLGKTSTGVPYIIIGKKVFTGYAERYNDSIKDAIINQYEINKDARYDLFVDMDNSDNNNDDNKVNNILFYGVIIIIFILLTIFNYRRLKKIRIEQ